MADKDITEQLSFDYNELDPPTRAFVREREERIHNLARMTATGIVQIGQYLSEVKERIGHGRFLQWIGDRFEWKQAQAYRFIQVYENVKITNLINLDIDVSALYLIAAPKTPEPVRNAILTRAGNGESITHQGVRAVVNRYTETGELPDIKVDLKKMISEERAKRQPPPEPEPTPEERAEARAIRERMRINQIWANAFMRVLQAIETLSNPELNVTRLAADMRRFDTPDKDWTGRTTVAIRTLEDLEEELER